MSPIKNKQYPSLPNTLWVDVWTHITPPDKAGGPNTYSQKYSEDFGKQGICQTGVIVWHQQKLRSLYYKGNVATSRICFRITFHHPKMDNFTTAVFLQRFWHAWLLFSVCVGLCVAKYANPLEAMGPRQFNFGLGGWNMRNSPYMNMSIAQDLQIFLRIISDIKLLSNVSWNLNTLQYSRWEQTSQNHHSLTIWLDAWA